MTEIESRMERLENHNKFFKDTLTILTEQNNKIYHAVVGDKNLGHIGIAERLADLEKGQEEIEEIKKKMIVNDVYFKQMIWVFVTLAGLILAFVVKENLLK